MSGKIFDQSSFFKKVSFASKCSILKKLFFREKGREEERKRNHRCEREVPHWLIASYTHPNWGTEPESWACSLIGNQTCDL